MSPRIWMRSLLAGPLLALAAPAGAQEPMLNPHVGAGVVVLAPHQTIGLSAQALSPRMGGIGIYVDARFDRSPPPSREPEFNRAITADVAEYQYGDRLVTEEDSWRSVNVALIRPLVPEMLLLYLGAGYSSLEHSRQYQDPSGERGVQGMYWVQDPGRSGRRLNLLGGGFFRVSSRVLVQFGVETRPRGMTAGAVYTLSRDRRR
jgi:hypothetical protein